MIAVMGWKPSVRSSDMKPLWIQWELILLRDVTLDHRESVWAPVCLYMFANKLCQSFRSGGFCEMDMDKKRVLPGGRDHYDGAGVDQVRVEQRPPPAAVQVGAFDHVRVWVDPEYQPTFDVHRQTLWTDQIYKQTIKNVLTSIKRQTTSRNEGVCVCVFLLVLMRISGSAPGAIDALLIVLADKSVQ